MKKKLSKELSAGTEADSSTKAEGMQVSPADAKPNVVGSLFSQREIKFRLWDFEENEMIYPSISFNEKYVLQINCEYIGQFNGKTYNTIKLPKMQYTGLKDKNGKEIYEGDILKSNYSLPLVVVFSDGKFCFYNSQSSGSDVLSQMRVEKLDVIGNIFENPELLQTLR